MRVWYGVSGWASRYFFFFQAEDGIRDDLVTGVQTCALPILTSNTSALEDHVHYILRRRITPVNLFTRSEAETKGIDLIMPDLVGGCTFPELVGRKDLIITCNH